MSDFGFITDNIRFSYSGITTFENCPHSYKLTYIDVEDKVENAFGQFGLLIHHVLEKYFAKEAQILSSDICTAFPVSSSVAIASLLS